MAEAEESYIDYDAFLEPGFEPNAFANSLVLSTNNPSDHPLDLNTPLSRVLFDVQEVDTHIDNLTRKSAQPLLEYTRSHVASGNNIITQLEAQVAALTEGYERLERDVLQRHESAEQNRIAAERLWQTTRLCRSISKCLTLGRQLDAQMNDFRGRAADKSEDHRAMVRASNTILIIRDIVQHEDGHEDLNRVTIVRTLRSELVEQAERMIIQTAEQIVSSFSMSSLAAAASNTTSSPRPSAPATYAQSEEARYRATSALLSLSLLSLGSDHSDSASSRLVMVLQEYLRRSISTSVASLASALSSLSKLDRTLIEVSARCQNVAALEILLATIKAPKHPNTANDESLSQSKATGTESSLLAPLLHSLDTSSLPSYFWRSMASQLTARVQKILKDGGNPARSLRSSKERLREAVRDCVNRGSQLPLASLSKMRHSSGALNGNWEREAAVMVSSIIGPLR